MNRLHILKKINFDLKLTLLRKKYLVLTSFETDSLIREFGTALTGNQEVASILAIALAPLSNLNSLIDS